MVKHVLHVPREVTPDTLEWRLVANRHCDSVHLECREHGSEGYWSTVLTISEDGKLYGHELDTKPLQWADNHRASLIRWKPSWNTNPSELKNHFGKLVTARTNSGTYHGLLSESGTDGVVFVGAWKGASKNIKHFCVHELPEEN